MAAKVNLKKYIAIGGRWRFVPVLKVRGEPRPEAVIMGETVKRTTGKFYIGWREDGKRIQRPVGSTPREAKEAWKTRAAILGETIEAPEDTEPLPILHISIKSAGDTFLDQVKATKSEGTHDAYKSDLDWFRNRANLGFLEVAFNPDENLKNLGSSSKRIHPNAHC